MRTKFRWDPDLEEVVEVRPNSNYFEERPQGPNLIRDDLGMGVNGLKHLPSGRMLDSKSAHYKENKRRGLEHVGNETNFETKREKPRADDYGRMVKDARDQLSSNWNGTADWARTQRRNDH